MSSKFTGSILHIAAKSVSRFNNGHWNFDKQMGEKEYVGFIYIIFDTVLKKYYLGKKNYRGAGKLNRGVESDWKRYKSSSSCLKAHFAERPKEEFLFICLEEYKKKGSLAWAETWSLCFVEAPTTDVWYNKRIEPISWNVIEHVTNKHKDRLQLTIGGIIPDE
jgi:hypothetical protein